MALLTTNHLTFTYPDEISPALDDVTLAVNDGDFIVLCGPSGSGKSTLLRLLKQEVRPHGSLSGTIDFECAPIHELDDASLSKNIGMVFQDPENQIVMDNVMGELIFGLENIGLATENMRKRVAEIVHFFGLEGLLDRPTHELSGGQMQIVNLASILLMEPRVLLLDEPTSRLDPISAKDFLNMLHRMNEELGIAVVMAEHRLEDVWPLADRVVVLEKGRVIHDGGARDVAEAISLSQKEAFLDYLPAPSRLYLRFGQEESENFPITVKEARSWVKGLHVSRAAQLESEDEMEKAPFILEARTIDFQYDKVMPHILDRLNLGIRKNEALAIVGGNGTGKSTLLKVLAGLKKPQRGGIYFNQKKFSGKINPTIGYLPQNPRLYFSEETVKGEILRAEQSSNLTLIEKGEILEWLNFEPLQSRHPYDLSGGEMQKLGMACLLLRGPEILLIDEPTKGLDPLSKKRFGRGLQLFKQKGITIVFVTHDIEFAANFSDRVGMMFQGSITTILKTDRFFKGNAFYTTAVDRVTRHADVPEVLTVEEAERAWAVQNTSHL